MADIAITQFIDVRLVWASHHRWRRGDTLIAHTASDYALWLVQDGYVEVTIAETQWRILPGAAFLIPCFVPRDIVTPGGAEWWSVGLQVRLFGQLDLLRMLEPPVLWQPKSNDHEMLQVFMQQSVRTWAGAVRYRKQTPSRIRKEIPGSLPSRPTSDAASLLIGEGLARSIFALCWRMLRGTDFSPTTHRTAPAWLDAALQYVREHPATTIVDWAKAVGYSPAQFRRVFHEHIGIAPQVYLKRHRLEEARALLETTNLKTESVAEHVGFESLAHFTRLFKETFGVPPARYRQLATQTHV